MCAPTFGKLYKMFVALWTNLHRLDGTPERTATALKVQLALFQIPALDMRSALRVKCRAALEGANCGYHFKFDSAIRLCILLNQMEMHRRCFSSRANRALLEVQHSTQSASQFSFKLVFF